MNLSDVQQSLYEYFKQKKIVVLLMQFAVILALVYPIYLIMTRLSFLNFITGILGHINIVFYFAYLIGLILCFAKRDMMAVFIAFALRTFVSIIDLFKFSVAWILYWVLLYTVFLLLRHLIVTETVQKFKI